MVPRRCFQAGAIALVILAGGCARQLGTVCGDGFCGTGESPAGCAADCAEPPVCGDGLCGAGETIATCAADCSAFCGNGVCDTNETNATCATDCGGDCGNGSCEPALGESCATCGADCGFCPGNEDDAVTCADGMDNDGDGDTDCADSECGPFCGSCGDGTCEGGETCGSCPVDCGMCCGDGSCDAGDGESCSTCPADCGSCCGNGSCESGMAETCSSCALDCGACCGNGFCESALGETCTTCAADCGACGCLASVDQSYTFNDSTVSVAPEYFGNSFTVGVTGDLTRIDVLGILDTGGTSTVTVELYSGGVCGIVPCGGILIAESHPFALGDNYFTLITPVSVVAGSAYTWRLFTGYGISSTLDTLGAYAGGWCLAYTGYDLNFVTWVDPCP